MLDNNIKAERSITRFARRIVPVVGGILLTAGLVWMISGRDSSFTAGEHNYRTGMTPQYVGENKPEPVHRVNELPLRQVVSSAVATRDAATQHIRDRLPATPDALTQPSRLQKGQPLRTHRHNRRRANSVWRKT